MRIMVMGGPGSGKSTLARRLGAELDLPVVHLDALHHGANWQPRPSKDFHDDVARATASPEWVIDGNYVSVAAERLARADRILLLAVPRRTRIKRLIDRILTGHGRVRPDSAPGCPERFDFGFLLYAWTWDRNVGPRVIAALAGHEDRLTVLRTDVEIDALMAKL